MYEILVSTALLSPKNSRGNEDYGTLEIFEMLNLMPVAKTTSNSFSLGDSMLPGSSADVVEGCSVPLPR